MLPTLARWAQQAAPAAARLQQLAKLRCDVLGTVHNPHSLRTGSKVLKARLRGPAMLRYYGERFSSFRGLNAAIPGLELRDLVEETRSVSLLALPPPRAPRGAAQLTRIPSCRLLDIETLRKRGKVKPKKGASGSLSLLRTRAATPHWTRPSASVGELG